MSSEPIIVERPADGVALIILNRPDKRNALNIPVFQALDEMLTELEQDDSVRAVVITGAGKVFSAGYDVKEMENLTRVETLIDYQTREPWMYHLQNFRKPLIAAMNGGAFGGGAMFAICADIRIGCEDSSFKVTAVPYGGINGSWNLPLIVGWGRAKEWLMTGRLVDAHEALASGLLNHLVPKDEVLPKAIEMAEAIAANPPGAVEGLKEVMHGNIGRGLAESYAAENTLLHTTLKPGRTAELFSKFLTK